MGEKERDKEEERGEMEEEKIGSFIFILLFDDGSLYYFNELFIKIETEMLSGL